MLAHFDGAILVKANLRRKVEVQVFRELPSNVAGRARQPLQHFFLVGIGDALCHVHFGEPQVAGDLDPRDVYIRQARIGQLTVEHDTDFLMNSFAHAFRAMRSHA